VSVLGTVFYLLCLEAFLGKLLCLICTGEPGISASLAVGIKTRLPDLPKNHTDDTNANPIMRKTY